VLETTPVLQICAAVRDFIQGLNNFETAEDIKSCIFSSIWRNQLKRVVLSLIEFDLFIASIAAVIVYI